MAMAIVTKVEYEQTKVLTIPANPEQLQSVFFKDVDNDLLTYSIITPPQNGVSGFANGFVTYKPNQDYNGPVSFTLKVNDGTVDM